MVSVLQNTLNVPEINLVLVSEIILLGSSSSVNPIVQHFSRWSADSPSP